MEHYRSTLAVTVVGVCGLLAAAQVLHPGNFERHPRCVRVVQVTAEAYPATMTWIDPPVRLRGPEPAGMFADSASLLAPRLTVALPSDVLTPPRLSSTLVAPPSIERRVKTDRLGDLIRELDRGREG